MLTEFCDKNDQRILFVSVLEELVRRYFNLDISAIGRAVLEFLKQMYSFPNHTFLLEKGDTLLSELRDYNRSAKQ